MTDNDKARAAATKILMSDISTNTLELSRKLKCSDTLILEVKRDIVGGELLSETAKHLLRTAWVA